MKVYVLTRGEYSDYHIIGVTLDEEKARQYADWYNKGNPHSVEWGCGMNVEEYEADKFTELQGLYRVTGNLGYLEAEPTEYMGETGGVVYLENGKIKKGYQSYVRAKDEKHAIKIGSEKIAKYMTEKIERGDQ